MIFGERPLEIGRDQNKSSVASVRLSPLCVEKHATPVRTNPVEARGLKIFGERSLEIGRDPARSFARFVSFAASRSAGTRNGRARDPRRYNRATTLIQPSALSLNVS